MQAFDVVINGGGIVGLALACGLGDYGLRIAVVERNSPYTISSTDRLASPRVSTINTASQRLLQHLQVWDNTIIQRANPYQGIEVWEKDSFGKIYFDSTQLGYPQLGHIVENTVIQQGLWQRAKQLADITLMTSMSIEQVVTCKNKVYITLDDNRMLATRLVVAADGANSWLRQYMGIPLTFWDYHHHALVAIVRTEQCHGNIARQAFHSDGILAFLPLSDPHLCSIVWSLIPEIALLRMTQPTERFNIELAIALNFALGRCELQDKRQSFPLSARYARDFAAHRLVLVGDAAHTIHPLTGQGVNLGLMDVAMLLGELRRLQKDSKDIGHHPYLRRYERNRKYSAVLALASIEGFYTLFKGNNLMKKLLRNTGLRVANTLPGIKLRFIRHAMGFNDVASWLATKFWE